MENALRDWLRDRLTPAMLDEVARLDHGMHVAENRAALQDLLAASTLPAELDRVPREVLELASHTGAPIVRLFACMVLIRAGATVPSTVVAGLTESAIEAGAAEEAAGYLAWCRGRERDDEVRPFLTLGLIALFGDRYQAEATGVHPRDLRPWRRIVQPVRLS